MGSGCLSELSPRLPPAEIHGERVVLRQHEPGFAMDLFRAVDGDRRRLRVFLPWVDLMHSVQDERDFIQSSDEQWARMTEFNYRLFCQTSGAFVGCIGMHTVSWQHRRCEIGYWVLGSFEGKGYASAAVLALEGAFFDLGFNRIEIRCSSANERSAGVPRRCGYYLEGVLRQDVIDRGRYRDTFVFSKLATQRSG